jgi:hypothetical protein
MRARNKRRLRSGRPGRRNQLPTRPCTCTPSQSTPPGARPPCARPPTRAAMHVAAVRWSRLGQQRLPTHRLGARPGPAARPAPPPPDRSDGQACGSPFDPGSQGDVRLEGRPPVRPAANNGAGAAGNPDPHHNLSERRHKDHHPAGPVYGISVAARFPTPRPRRAALAVRPAFRSARSHVVLSDTALAVPGAPVPYPRP